MVSKSDAVYPLMINFSLVTPLQILLIQHTFPIYSYTLLEFFTFYGLAYILQMFTLICFTFSSETRLGFSNKWNGIGEMAMI